MNTSNEELIARVKNTRDVIHGWEYGGEKINESEARNIQQTLGLVIAALTAPQPDSSPPAPSGEAAPPEWARSDLFRHDLAIILKVSSRSDHAEWQRLDDIVAVAVKHAPLSSQPTTPTSIRTIDHPESNGRKAQFGEKAYTMSVTNEQGEVVTIEMGKTGFETVTNLLLDMLSHAEPSDDLSTTEAPYWKLKAQNESLALRNQLLESELQKAALTAPPPDSSPPAAAKGDVTQLIERLEAQLKDKRWLGGGAIREDLTDAITALREHARVCEDNERLKKLGSADGTLSPATSDLAKLRELAWNASEAATDKWIDGLGHGRNIRRVACDAIVEALAPFLAPATPGIDAVDLAKIKEISDQLFRDWVGDKKNDGTYTLDLSPDDTERFFGQIVLRYTEAFAALAPHLAPATPKGQATGSEDARRIDWLEKHDADLGSDGGFGDGASIWTCAWRTGNRNDKACHARDGDSPRQAIDAAMAALAAPLGVPGEPLRVDNDVRQD